MNTFFLQVTIKPVPTNSTAGTFDCPEQVFALRAQYLEQALRKMVSLVREF